MGNRNPSGIDFRPDDTDFGEDDIEFDDDLASAAQYQPQRQVRHDPSPTIDPNAMRSRVSWDDASGPEANEAVGPLFALFLVLIVAAMIGAAYWWITPSDDQVKAREYIKSRTF
jgi:hypothetical protein